MCFSLGFTTCLWVIADSQGDAGRKSEVWAASLLAANSPQLGAVLKKAKVLKSLLKGGMALNQD